VKMADLLDNMNLLRIREPAEKDFKRVKRYHEAYKVLEAAGRGETST